MMICDPPGAPHSAAPLDRTNRFRHGSLARRAFANIDRNFAIAVVAIGLAAACQRTGADKASEDSAARTPQARVQELVLVLTPLDKTVTSDITDAKFLRGRALLADLRDGGRDLGLEALRVLREGPKIQGEKAVDIERGLLDVAAHAAPVDARPLLEALVTQYGTSLALRTEAALLFAETSPAEALPVLEPMVTLTRPSQTMPPGEFLVKAWVIACEKTGRSPVPELAKVATDLFAEESARVRAVGELGKHTEPLAAQALQAILIESTGDGYLRRKAAQGIRDTLPRESACGIFEKVASREADVNFALFLADMLDKNCTKTAFDH